MAEIKAHGEVTLTQTYSTPPTKHQMPRADDTCSVCFKPKREHGVDLKCLFESTTFQPMTIDSFRSVFLAWAQGQQIEEALVNIVYALTKGPT